MRERIRAAGRWDQCWRRLETCSIQTGTGGKTQEKLIIMFVFNHELNAAVTCPPTGQHSNLADIFRAFLSHCQNFHFWDTGIFHAGNM